MEMVIAQLGKLEEEEEEAARAMEKVETRAMEKGGEGGDGEPRDARGEGKAAEDAWDAQSEGGGWGRCGKWPWLTFGCNICFPFSAD